MDLAGVMAWCLVHWTPSLWVQVQCSRWKLVFPFFLSLLHPSHQVLEAMVSHGCTIPNGGIHVQPCWASRSPSSFFLSLFVLSYANVVLSITCTYAMDTCLCTHVRFRVHAYSILYVHVHVGIGLFILGECKWEGELLFPGRQYNTPHLINRWT